jgi:hypothetical protein
MSGDERREAPRYAVEIEARVTADDASWQARTRDLSRTGMCFTIPTPVAVGTPITVEAALKFSATASSEALPLAGRVVWCTRVPEGYQVGCAFLRLSHQIGQYLDLFLRYLKGEIDINGAVVDEDAEDVTGDKFA